jgi:putative component of toxin-antitoxin plasmid stabilization module
MVRSVEPKTVLVYQDAIGREPFTDWLTSLRDQKGRRAILKRISRLEQGLYGDCEPVAFRNYGYSLAQVTGSISVKRRVIS